jgi:hypothetical protein
MTLFGYGKTSGSMFVASMSVLSIPLARYPITERPMPTWLAIALGVTFLAIHLWAEFVGSRKGRSP